jgi:hypothetical protein
MVMGHVHKRRFDNDGGTRVPRRSTGWTDIGPLIPRDTLPHGISQTLRYMSPGRGAGQGMIPPIPATVCRVTRAHTKSVSREFAVSTKRVTNGL